MTLSEVLSQSEIDSLLNALSTGEVDVKEIEADTKEKKIRNYDFRNPQKMAKDQLRTLEIIHENFSRLLQTFLSGYLSTPVKITLLSVEQLAYSEFSNAISNPAFLSIVNFSPLPGECIYDISPEIAFAIIDRLLGGDGEKAYEIRTFTEIELTLLTKTISKTNDLISRAWENVIELNPYLEKIETNPQFAQVVSPNETIALITLNISIGETDGMFNICIPHIVIESIMDKLTTKLWFSKTKKTSKKDNIEIIEKRLKNALIELKAELASSDLTVKELLDLQLGDVIKLGNFDGKEVVIKVGTEFKFYGKPGTIGKNMAVKIARVKKDGDEADD